MNALTLYAPNPEQLLATTAYGVGALMRVESSLVGGGSGFVELGTVALVAGTDVYTYFDTSGTTGTWYRTRYSNSGNTNRSDYSAEFQALTAPRVQYATLAGVKLRLLGSGTAVSPNDDPLLTVLCNQVAGWVESTTGRVLGPVPAFTTTTNGAISAGATSIVLTTTTGLAIGDALMLGPVTGTHEHVIVADILGNTVTPQTPVVNAYSGGATAQRCYLLDGGDALEGGRMLPVSDGIVTMTSLEVAYYTGGAFQLIPPTDWFLRPLPIGREPGWPATELWMTDIPSSGNPAPMFYAQAYGSGGFATARCLLRLGWPAIPDEIVGLAEKLVVGLFRARGAGGGGQVVVGSDGQRTIERLLDMADWKLINRYTAKDVVII